MISAKDVEAAYSRIGSFIHNTPVFSSQYIDQLSGASVVFKCENFQKTGSFKARGAINSILQLSEEEQRAGVATHSSGNHGQALAWAASCLNIPAYIVMPENAPLVKIEAVKAYGGEVIFCKPTLAAREEILKQVMEKHHCTFIPPYNATKTIVGQSSCGYEFLQEFKKIDCLMAPVGGGGLLSGTALAARYFSDDAKVYGCEPELACDAYESFYCGSVQEAKEPLTIADGLRTSLGDITFNYISEMVEDILLCSESEILEAQQLLMERMKIVVETSAAVPLACLIRYRNLFAGKKVGIILSGGNVDLRALF